MVIFFVIGSQLLVPEGSRIAVPPLRMAGHNNWQYLLSYSLQDQNCLQTEFAIISKLTSMANQRPEIPKSFEITVTWAEELVPMNIHNSRDQLLPVL